MGIENRGDRFTVLVVCSGNICRSPIAEQLLRSRLGGASAPWVRLLSAGTIAQDGTAMTPEAAEVSRRYGGDPSGHAAVAVTPQLVDDADLILTAAREHRAEVVSLVPRASRRTFTVREFARLLGAIDADELSAIANAEDLVVAAAARRGFTPPLADVLDDDIEDPYLQSSEVYDRVGAQLDAAVTTIAAALGPIVLRIDSTNSPTAKNN